MPSHVGRDKIVIMPAAVEVELHRAGVHGCERIGFNVTNLGANNITAFSLRAKAGAAMPDSDAIAITTTPQTVDTTVLRQFNMAVPFTVADGLFIVDCEGLSELILYATSTLGTTVQTAWAAT